MTIAELPVINYLTFEVWDAGTAAWRDLQTKATTVTINRGGSRNGAANKIAVGTLDATLYGDVDLSSETALRPNAPIRVVQPLSRVVPAWNSEARNPTTSVFTSVLPAVLEPLGVITGIFQTDTANGVTTGTGTGVQLPKSMPQTTVPTGSANRVALRILGAETGAQPGLLYSLGAAARDTSPPYPTASLRLVAYAYNPANGTIGATLGTGAPRTASAVTSAFPSVVITWPAHGTSVLLAVEVAAATNVVNTNAGSGKGAFILAFEPVTIGRYYPTTPRFTGAIADVAQTVAFDKGTNTKRTFTTLYAVDAVQSLANTQRYGAVSASGLGYQPWAERIQQLASSALVPVAAPPASERLIYAWPGQALAPFVGYDFQINQGSLHTTLVAGDTPAIQSQFVRAAGQTAALSWTPSVSLFDTKIPAAGRYRVEFDLTVITSTGATVGGFAVQYDKSAFPVAMPAAGQTVHVSQEFTATRLSTGPHLVSTSPTVLTAGSGTREFTFQISGYVLRAIGDPKGYQLADIAYESDLASHFDLACNSVGARWWVDRDGVTQFSRTFVDPVPAVTFTDDGTALGYVDLGLAFDTRNVVNALTLNQHGRDAATGDTADYSATFTNAGSVTRWGSRAGDLDTCLYVGAGFQDSPSVRAREVTDALGRPTYSISSLRWNVQENPRVMPLLDIYTPIAAAYGPLTQVARIIGIKETITPTRWVIDLNLTDIKAGATFDDLNDAWAGLTFAQVNARIAGKNFVQFNANPTA